MPTVPLAGLLQAAFCFVRLEMMHASIDNWSIVIDLSNHDPS